MPTTDTPHPTRPPALAGQVSLRMYEEWAHTDAILEGPVRGDCTLCNDMVKQVCLVAACTYFEVFVTGGPAWTFT